MTSVVGAGMADDCEHVSSEVADVGVDGEARVDVGVVYEVISIKEGGW